MRSMIVVLLACALFPAAAAATAPAAATPAPAPASVPLPAYNVSGTLVRGFTIGYGVKYLLWGPIDDASFTEVDAGSLPAKAGIKTGDRILAIDGQPVRTMKRRAFERAAFRNDSTLRFEIETPGSASRTVTLVWPANFWDSTLTPQPTAR